MFNANSFFEKIKNFWTVKRMIWLLIILLITFWVNFYVIPDRHIPISQTAIIEQDNQSYLDLSSFNLKQEDYSGNLNDIFWKIIYISSGKDRICFEKINYSNDDTFSANYNNGRFFNISHKKCIDISTKATKILVPQVSYGISITIPQNLSLISNKIVNKSECVWILSDNTCVTQEGINNAVTQVYYPDGEIYLEANWFHRIIKCIFIFFSVGAVLWAFSRTFYLIKYGWDK